MHLVQYQVHKNKLRALKKELKDILLGRLKGINEI